MTSAHIVSPTQGHAAKNKGAAASLLSLLSRKAAPVRPPPDVRHPLDPLSADEVAGGCCVASKFASNCLNSPVLMENLHAVAAKVCREQAKKEGLPSLRFNAISLQVLGVYSHLTFQDDGSYCSSQCPQEPAKAELIRYESTKSNAPERLAFCVLQVDTLWVFDNGIGGFENTALRPFQNLLLHSRINTVFKI